MVDSPGLVSAIVFAVASIVPLFAMSVNYLQTNRRDWTDELMDRIKFLTEELEMSRADVRRLEDAKHRLEDENHRLHERLMQGSASPPQP